MKTIGVIPARLESTRLPRKPLLDICGKPMIQHVWERTIESKLDEVIIATDSEEIYQSARLFGASVVMTSPEHDSGTSRLVELSSKLKADFYVNIQGDEPLISSTLINDLIYSWRLNSERMVYTAANPTITDEEYISPNVVKVVTDTMMDALYFSRAPIPYFRNNETSVKAMKHIGIYGYTTAGLDFYKERGPGPLEKTELLEQLRFLEYGNKIRVILTEYESIGVDTMDDLLRVRKIIGM